ncbi:MAG: ABC transporter permease subunit [Clostridia bacterium]|nr:ABC transporter permease subunit [Clostridia bacterium]
MKKTLLKNGIQAVVLLALVLGVWAIAYFAAGNELLVPAFSNCMKELLGLLTQGGFWQSVGNTLLRTLLAFGIALVLAVIFAVLACVYPKIGRGVSLLASVFRTLPTLAVALILLVWWGADDAPVAVAFLSLFPMLYTGILAALSQVDGELIEMSRVYKVPVKKRITRLYLPSAAPYALREAGSAAAFALKLVVSAEVLVNTYKSLGGMMQEARIYLDIPVLFALVCVTTVLGVAIELACGLIARAVERRVK